ncbi:uncharacterized protein P884DRAFT_253544 [Thermothelomyces heterothallicus CBS 202.75]|uniref:uncharacterized protein n=1 Tax=Thermothelomyces heterothallicus CBS 202.75 TaxID=1149848 RepID=UPI003743DB00
MAFPLRVAAANGGAVVVCKPFFQVSRSTTEAGCFAAAASCPLFFLSLFSLCPLLFVFISWYSSCSCRPRLWPGLPAVLWLVFGATSRMADLDRWKRSRQDAKGRGVEGSRVQTSVVGRIVGWTLGEERRASTRRWTCRRGLLGIR